MPRCVWFVLTIGALGFVLRFGVNCPYMDEWTTLTALQGAEPLGPWLWRWHNEHRLPLPRFIYWLGFVLTHDLRPVMLLNVIGWSALAALLLRVARQVRGRSAWTDVAVPVLLLHGGQWENWLMADQVCCVCVALLVGVWLRELALRRPGWGSVLATPLLPLCGTAGLILAGPAVVGLLLRRTRAALFAVGLTLTIIAAYVQDFPLRAGTAPTLGQLTHFLLAFTAIGAGLGVQALGIGGAWPLLLSLWVRWTRVNWGLLAAVVAVGLLGVAIAWGRAAAGCHAAYYARYSGLSVLGWLALYLLCVPQPRLAALLALWAMLVWPANALVGYQASQAVAQARTTLLADMQSGMPANFVAERANWLLYPEPAYLTTALPRWQTTAPPLRVVIVELPAEGPWTLPAPQFVAAVRIAGQYRTPHPTALAQGRLSWAGGTATAWLRRGPSPNRGDAAGLFWVNGYVQELHFRPDRRPCKFRPTRIELWLPAER
jgi:hypothetical protein